MAGTDPGAPGSVPAPSPVVALGAIVPRATAGNGVHWSLAGERDLEVNLAHLDPGARLPAHTNDELDVVIVVISGGGRLALAGDEHELTAPMLAFAAKGIERSLVAGADGLTYLTVHRRRGTLGIGRAPSEIRPTGGAT